MHWPWLHRIWFTKQILRQRTKLKQSWHNKHTHTETQIQIWMLLVYSSLYCLHSTASEKGITKEKWIAVYVGKVLNGIVSILQQQKWLQEQSHNFQSYRKMRTKCIWYSFEVFTHTHTQNGWKNSCAISKVLRKRDQTVFYSALKFSHTHTHQKCPKQQSHNFLSYQKKRTIRILFSFKVLTHTHTHTHTCTRTP